MINQLDHIRATLLEGIKLSGQSSYSRRAIEGTAEGRVREVQTRLQSIIHAGQASREVYGLLALSHEILLEYYEAIQALEAGIKQSPRVDKKDLKRLARYKEQLNWWETITLTPQQLNELGTYLRHRLAAQPHHERSFRWTKAWLEEAGHRFPDKVISGLERLGAYDDFQVLHNIVAG